jgi:hypothetical protein
MFPKPVIHSGQVIVPAGGRAWLFSEVADYVTEVGERVPVKVVLLSFSVTRDRDIWLQFYDVRDPIFEPLNTNGLPGLDRLVEPIGLTVHIGHELRCLAYNRGTSDKTIAYFFYLEQRREDNVATRQYIFAGSPVLSARETDYEALKFAVAPDEIGILYRIAADRNSSIRLFVELDGQKQPPTAGIFAGALPGLPVLAPVYYLVVGPEGDRELRVTLTNGADQPQEVPYCILVNAYKATKPPEEKQEEKPAG